jgi:hypothetical protein
LIASGISPPIKHREDSELLPFDLIENKVIGESTLEHCTITMPKEKMCSSPVGKLFDLLGKEGVNLSA